jgi:very-short-patch-repair endonuclease
MSLFSRPQQRKCRRCGAVFAAKSERDYYCGEACRRQGSPKIKRVCTNCGREFELEQYLVERGQGKFCSLECYHTQKPQVERVCKTCGKTFMVKAYYAEKGWGDFCSKECQQRSYEAQRVERRCQLCGKVFTVNPAVAEKGGGKYCSKTCRDSAKRDYVILTCEACGRQFSTPRSNVNRGGGKFCSRNCFDQHAVVVATCTNCGKQFEVWKSELKYGRKFCSRQCYQLYSGETSIETLIRLELERRHEEFIPQATLGPYSVDFLLPKRKKVIECDGTYWHGLPESIIRDRRKDTYLTRQGFRVYRLSEKEIRQSPETCIDWILRDG